MKKTMAKTLRFSLLLVLVLMLSTSVMVTAFAGETDDALTAEELAQLEADKANGTVTENGDYTYNDGTAAGGSGTESGGANTGNDNTWTGTTETKENVLYTTGVEAVYSREYDTRYSMSVMLNTSTPMSSYQIEFEMPWFTTIQSVRAGSGVNVTPMNPAYSSHEGNIVRANYVSDEYFTGNFEILVVEFTVNSGDVWGTPSIYTAEFANADGVSFSVPFAPQTINVTNASEGGGDITTYALGDVDMDGSITLNDLTMVQRSLVFVDKEYLGEMARSLADVNRDGSITIMDCQYIKMYLVGKISSFDEINGGNNNEEWQNVKIEFYLMDNNKGALVRVDTTDAYFSVNTSMNEIYNRYDGYNGYKIINIYRDRDFNTIIGREELLDTNVLYIEVEQGIIEEPVKAEVEVVFVDASSGESMGGSWTDGAQVGMSLYEYAMNLANERTMNGMYTVEGIYMDDTFSKPVSDSQVIYENCHFIVYVRLSFAGIEGSYMIVERQYSEESGEVSYVNAGRITLTAENATVTLGSMKYAAEYEFYRGNVVISHSDRSIMILCLTTNQEGTTQFVLEYNFDESTYEQPAGTDFTPYAGEYYVEAEGESLNLQLFEDGVFSMHSEGITIYGTYTYEVRSESDTRIFLDVMGEISEAKYDGKTIIPVTNTDSDNGENIPELTDPSNPNDETQPPVDEVEEIVYQRDEKGVYYYTADGMIVYLSAEEIAELEAMGKL